MAKELTFILQKGEKIIIDIARCQYAGVGYVMTGGAFGTQFGNTGLAGGVFGGQQMKREGSIFDSKTAHVYLTNKRIVFCKTKVGLFDNAEKEIGAPFAEIPFNVIRGLNKSTKLSCPAIDISVAGPSGIDNVKFWFFNVMDKREGERDKIFDLIKKQV